MKPVSNGYGRLCFGGKCHSVHRVSWLINKGPIPASMSVLHKCDNRLCCNPRHLFLGTGADNMADRDAKGRQARGVNGGTTILTVPQVLEIRKAGGRQVDIADRFGITQPHVSAIKLRKIWAHIP